MAASPSTKIIAHDLLKMRKETAETESECLEVTDCSSDIEVVLCESSHLLELSSKIVTNPDFFSLRAGEDDVDFNTGDEMAYDSTPPPKNQIIGATPAYIEHLKAHPPKLEKLAPVFKLEETRRPSILYWNFPRAITDYSIVEAQMTPVIPNGGIKKVICKEGKGEKLLCGNNVLINYYVYVEGNDCCVESNKKWKKPHSFVLGNEGGGGLPVVNLGTLTMKVKEIAAFIAMPEYAYGKLGMGMWIPANKRALCVIEVLSKLPAPSDSSSIINMVAAERKLLSFDKIYSFALRKKLDGNKDLSSNKNVRAMRKYLQAAGCLLDASATNEEQENQKLELLHTLYGNISIASFRTNQFPLAVEFSEKAIELPIAEEDKAHDYVRCARALYYDQKWEKAKPYIDTAAMLIEDDPQVAELQKYIQTAMEEMTFE